MAKIQEMSADISLFLYLIDCLYQLLYIKVRIDILSDRLACVSKDPGDLGGIYLSFVEHVEQVCRVSWMLRLPDPSVSISGVQ